MPPVKPSIRLKSPSESSDGLSGRWTGSMGQPQAGYFGSVSMTLPGQGHSGSAM